MYFIHTALKPPAYTQQTHLIEYKLNKVQKNYCIIFIYLCIYLEFAVCIYCSFIGYYYFLFLLFLFIYLCENLCYQNKGENNPKNIYLPAIYSVI